MKRLFAILLLMVFSMAGCARTTPTEAKAIIAAKADHTAYTLPPEKVGKAEAISVYSDWMYFIGAGWGLLLPLLILETGAAAWMRDRAVNLRAKRWTQGLIFWLELLAVLALANLPLRMYAHHKSVGFGFSILHWPAWFADMGKSLLLEYAAGCLFVVVVFYLVRRFPRRWWLWLWFPTMAIVLFSVYLEPVLVDPWFNDFTPLAKANPALLQQLEQVAKHGGLEIPPERMFVMNASKKTTLMNAYVTGFGGSKRLVIWDTLLKKATPDEIAIVAGHEMGHYVLGHIVRGMVEAFAGLLAAFFVGFHLFQFCLRRWGGRWHVTAQDDWAAMVIMLLVLNVLVFFAEPIGNVLSRQVEHDADVFGQEAVHGIVADPQATGQAAEQMFGEAMYVEPNQPAAVEFWTDSHPSTSFRAAFAKHYDPWAAGEEPKFFKK